MKKKSKLGYKRYSPDVNNPYNIIPSGRITMKDVDFPVYGVDNFGNEQMMYPGGEYQFPGNQVFEIPMSQEGGQNNPGSDTYVDPEMMFRDKYNTELAALERKKFDKWVTKESKRQGRDILMDMGAYDVQGFWKSGDYKRMDQDNHGTDTWKKPNHPTFSNQSKYHGANGWYGGNWTKDGGYQPSKQTLETYGSEYYDWIFGLEPNRPEHLDMSRYESGINRPTPLYYKKGGSLYKAQAGLETPQPYIRPDFFSPQQIQAAEQRLQQDRIAAARAYATPATGRIEGEGLIDVVLPVVAAPIVKAIAKPIARVADDVIKRVVNKPTEIRTLATFSPADNAGKVVVDIPQPWKMQELPGLHLKSTMEGEAISKIVEPKTGLINTEQALAIIAKESGGADKVKLVREALGDNIPKKMDFNNFRKTVQDKLIPLERQLSTHRSNYGIDRLGYYNTDDAYSINKTWEQAGFSRPLENQTLTLGNRSKFGRGSSAHGNPEETLGHAHFLRDAETPDVFTVTQIQSDAFQGTHRNMPKNIDIANNQLLEYENTNIIPLEERLAYDRLEEIMNREEVLAKYKNNPNYITDKKAEIENFTQKQLLDKNHQERYLQELVDYAGKRGDVNKVRVPTSETAAKVQGYIPTTTAEEIIEKYNKLKGTSEWNNIMVDTPDADKLRLQKVLEGKIKGDIYDLEKTTILKKYSEQPKTIKKLFGKEPTIVTDSKGNTWYEFDIPEKFKQGKGEIKAFGLAPLIGVGAAGAYNANQSKYQQGGQMSASAGYDSWYNSPMAAGRYTFNPKDPAEYYVEGYGTKQGPGIAAGMEYINPKYRTRAMLRAGIDPEIGASLRGEGGYRFNPIDNRREQFTWGPYGGVRFQTEDYQQGRPTELAYNNLQTDLAYGVNARYNKALANRGRFSVEGDLGMTMGKRPEGNLGEGLDPRFYGAVKATYSPPMYKNTRNRKPGPTTYSSGYKKGGLVKAQFGIQTAAFMPMMAQAYGAVSSWFNDDSKPATTTPAAPENVDWRTLSRPKQIDYAIGELTAFEKEENRKALENLLESTAYMENRYGEDPRAYGRNYTSSFMSIDPIALQDMFTGRGANGAYNSAQRRQFETFKQLNLPTDQKQFDALLREDNPVAAMAAARYRYALVPQALPAANDQQGMFDYWLKYYNGNGILKHKTRAQAYKDFQRAYQRALSND